MPRFRDDLEAIPVYQPGPPAAELAHELGLERIIELAANECPVEPLPEVRDAIAAAASQIHRYPPSDAYYLVRALADLYEVAPDRIWVSPGSTSILTSIALAACGPGASVVFADPSFVVYRMAALLAGATPIPVPVDAEWRLDPDALLAAIRPDTAVLYFCNPNNPTATHSSAAAVRHMVDSIPDRLTLVIDEAYAEYATAPDYSSAVPHTLDRDNVIVTRTFSKVYGLAGARVGYAFGDPETIGMLRRPQAPYAIAGLSQVAALEALRHQGQIEERVTANDTGRRFIVEQLRRLDQFAIDSQTNFVLWRPDADSVTLAASLLKAGIMVRPLGPWIRVTVGTATENQIFVEAVAEVIASATDR